MSRFSTQTGREAERVPASQFVAAAARDCLRKSCYAEIRRLSFEYDDGVLYLRGYLPSFYYKQLADVVESVTGAVTLACGLNCTQDYLRLIGVLERGGLVKGELDGDTRGAPKKMYTLTEDGRSAPVTGTFINCSAPCSEPSSPSGPWIRLNTRSISPRLIALNRDIGPS